MSLPTAPARRLVSRCLSCNASVSAQLQRQQRRTAVSDFFKRGSPAASSKSEEKPRPNPVLEEFLRKNPDAAAAAAAQPSMQQMPTPGDIGATSIFEYERRIEKQRKEEDAADVTAGAGDGRDPRVTARVLNPDPNARERWERKKVIQMVRKGGRISREQFVKRTEREHLVKSHNMKTSIKKLGMLARQIAGKTIDDAITQMRFSKKKVAQEVLKQLEFARDEAVVMRGMGLATISPAEVADHDGPPASSGPVEIQLKDGSRHKVTDPSKIYIDQAWIGRGPYGQLPDYRARGRVSIMRTPWTSITVLLKEEATRIREHEEREAKRLRQKTRNPWVPLPDRPVQVQRQWYSW